MISQIVFDWNGTLLADSHVRHRLHCITLNKLGHAGLSFNEYQEKFFIPITDYYSSLGISAEKVKNMAVRQLKSFIPATKRLLQNAELEVVHEIRSKKSINKVSKRLSSATTPSRGLTYSSKDSICKICLTRFLQMIIYTPQPLEAKRICCQIILNSTS